MTSQPIATKARRLRRSRYHASPYRVRALRTSGPMPPGPAMSGPTGGLGVAGTISPICSRAFRSSVMSLPLRLPAQWGPRIEERVADVNEQVDEQDRDEHERHAAEDDGIVTLTDGEVDREPDARPVEHRLGQDGAGEHRSQVQPDERDDGDERVLHLVAPQ